MAAGIVAATVAVLAATWALLLDYQTIEAQGIRQRAEIRATQLTQAVALDIDASLRSLNLALRHLRSVYQADRRIVDLAVKDVTAVFPEGMLQYTVVVGEAGRMAYSSGPDQAPVYLGDREPFRFHQASGGDEMHISTPFTGVLSKAPLVLVSRPLRDGLGRRCGGSVLGGATRNDR